MSELYCKYCGRYLCKYNEKERVITEWCPHCKKETKYINNFYAKLTKYILKVKNTIKLKALFRRGKE
jgi:hypothetical protein